MPSYIEECTYYTKEGTQYELYSYLGITVDNYELPGTAEWVWTRSSCASSLTQTNTSYDMAFGSRAFIVINDDSKMRCAVSNISNNFLPAFCV
jgi:hypothetical protein